MKAEQQLAIVERVLKTVAGREGCYPDGDIAEEIIQKVRNLTGNTAFCGDHVQQIDFDSNLYEVRVYSWENDFDNTEELSTFDLTAEDVKFYLAICHKFRRRRDGGYGNQEYSDDFYGLLIDELLKQHPNISDDVKRLWTAPEGYNETAEDRGNSYYDTLQCVIGAPVDYDYGWARVVESVTVYAMIDGVRTDVTEQFK